MVHASSYCRIDRPPAGRCNTEQSRNETAAAAAHPEAMEHSSCCFHAAPALLAHISIFIAIYGGAMLATGARLKWDPTTYILVREVLPEVYRSCAALLPVAGALLVAQAHVALAALAARSPGTKRVLWLVYIVCTVVMLVVEVTFVVWVALSVQDWLHSEAAQHLKDTAEIKEHLLSLLGALERWMPLPARLRELIQEAEVDAPVNAYVAGGAGAVLLVLQLAALLSVGLALATTPAPPPRLAYKGMYGPLAQHRMQYSPGVAAAAAAAAR